MSFYTGKDNSNDAILHITNGVTPQSSMKAGVLANSVFHSSLPYLEIEEYTCTVFEEVVEWFPLHYIVPELAFINDLDTNGYFFVINDKYLFYGQTNGTYCWVRTGSESYYHYHSDYRITPSVSYNKCAAEDLSKFIAVYGLANISIKAYIVKNLKFVSFVPFTPIQNEIKIDAETFNVKGKNLYTTKFIQQGKVNDVDVCVYPIYSFVYTDNWSINIDEAYKYTLINTRATGNLSISSNAAETKISRGDTVIFTSLNLTKSKYLRKEPDSPWYTWLDITSRTGGSLTKEIKLPYKDFSVGDMFCIPSTFAEHMPPQDVSKAPTLANIFTYVIGDIGILASILMAPEGPNGYRSCYTTIRLTGKADGYLYAQCSAYIYNETGILTRWVGYFQTTVVRFY